MALNEEQLPGERRTSIAPCAIFMPTTDRCCEGLIHAAVPTAFPNITEIIVQASDVAARPVRQLGIGVTDFEMFLTGLGLPAPSAAPSGDKPRARK